MAVYESEWWILSVGIIYCKFSKKNLFKLGDEHYLLPTVKKRLVIAYS